MTRAREQKTTAVRLMMRLLLAASRHTSRQYRLFSCQKTVSRVLVDAVELTCLRGLVTFSAQKCWESEWDLICVLSFIINGIMLRVTYVEESSKVHMLECIILVKCCL